MKKLLLGIVALCLCFGLVACGEENLTNNEIEKEQSSETEVVKETENNVEKETEELEESFEDIYNALSDEEKEKIASSVDDVAMIKEGNNFIWNISDGMIAKYYTNGSEVTGYEITVVYETNEEAIAAKTEYELDPDPDDNIESLTVDGNKLLVVYNEAEYEDMTYDELEELYNAFSTIKGE